MTDQVKKMAAKNRLELNILKLTHCSMTKNILERFCCLPLGLKKRAFLIGAFF